MAAGGTASQVQLGPGRLYVAPVGTSEPSNASTALPSAWIVIGYTDTGSTFTSTLTREEVPVAEEIDPIRYVLTARASKLELAMAQSTKRRLYLALGGGIGQLDDGTAFEPPDPSLDVATMIVWDSNEDPTIAQDGQGNRRWLFRQARPSGDVAIARQKAPAKSLLPVTFNLEKPTGLAPFKIFPNSNGLI